MLFVLPEHPQMMAEVAVSHVLREAALHRVRVGQRENSLCVQRGDGAHPAPHIRREDGWGRGLAWLLAVEKKLSWHQRRGQQR